MINSLLGLFAIVSFPSMLLGADTAKMSGGAPAPRPIGKPMKGDCHPQVENLIDHEDQATKGSLTGHLAVRYNESCENMLSPEYLGNLPKNMTKGLEEPEKLSQFLQEKIFPGFTGTQRFNPAGCDNRLNPDQTRRIVSKYYFLSSKAETMQNDSIARIASIERALLGSPQLQNIKCENAYPSARKTCESIKACPPQSKEQAMKKMVDKTKENLEKISEAKADLAKLGEQSVRDSHRLSKEEKQDIRVRAKALTLLIQSLKAEIPWTEGKGYLATVRDSKDTSILEIGIRNQLSLDKKEAIGNWVKSSGAQRCLSQTPVSGDDCSATAFNEITKKVPGVPEVWPNKNSGENASDYGYANLHLRASQCAFERKENEQARADMVDNFVRDRAVDAVALFFGGVGLAYRFAAGGARLGAAASRIDRIRALKLARAETGLNQTGAAWDAMLAIQTCSDEAQSIEIKNKSSNPQCDQLSAGYTGSPELEAYNRCLSNVFMGGAMGLRGIRSKAKAEEAERKLLAEIGEDTTKRIASKIADQFPNAKKAETLSYELKNLRERIETTSNPAEKKALQVQWDSKAKEYRNVVGNLSDAERIAFAESERVLGRTLSDKEKSAIIKAHELYRKQCQLGSCPEEFKQAKADEIVKLTAGSITPQDARRVVDKGVAGHADDAIQIESRFRQHYSYTPTSRIGELNEGALTDVGMIDSPIGVYNKVNKIYNQKVAALRNAKPEDMDEAKRQLESATEALGKARAAMQDYLLDPAWIKRTLNDQTISVQRATTPGTLATALKSRSKTLTQIANHAMISGDGANANKALGASFDDHVVHLLAEGKVGSDDAIKSLQLMPIDGEKVVSEKLLREVESAILHDPKLKEKVLDQESLVRDENFGRPGAAEIAKWSKGADSEKLNDFVDSYRALRVAHAEFRIANMFEEVGGARQQASGSRRNLSGSREAYQGRMEQRQTAFLATCKKLHKEDVCKKLAGL